MFVFISVLGVGCTEMDSDFGCKLLIYKWSWNSGC